MDQPNVTDRACLVAEGRRLCAEIVRAKQTLRALSRCDADLVAQLSRHHDRLDDIAAVIGAMTVLRIYCNVEAETRGPEALEIGATGRRKEVAALNQPSMFEDSFDYGRRENED